ncbi:Cytochrome P450 3A24 [Holothuria leucospilota]|uniref:Thromboxane-A synthase n=1 Tax=Holothuria leucospilota TaxID=206669 RepID=A0A9Q1CHD9_HOLLE|nr:Cytochrome P450 3A24 [Holothuria leucospilota]
MSWFQLSLSKWTLGGIAVLLFLIYDFWKQTFLRRKGIPGPFPYPIVGSTFSVTGGFATDTLKLRKTYGKIFGISMFGRPSIFIADLDMIRETLISRFSVFPNRETLPLKDRPLDQSISSLKGEQWREARNTLTPAFTGNKLRQMDPIINECCDQLVEHLDQLSKDESTIQFKEVFGSYTMDIIAATFFGLKIDSHKNPNDPFVKHAQDAFSITLFSPRVLLVMLTPWICPLMNKLDIGLIPAYIKNFFMKIVKGTIASRESSESKRVDMLQLMMNAHNLGSEEGEDSSSKKKPLSTDAIMANSLVFFLAGYETTNTSLSFTSYLLATNPEVQAKLIEEVDKFTLTRDDVCYDVLKEMEYLDACIKESLRIYPSVAATERENDKGNVIKGLEIPKDVSVTIPIYAIHHDPDLWEEPEQFRPERFNKENQDKIHPMAWLPFGAGPRICIGLRLAMVEMKFALIRILQKYEFKTCSDTEISLLSRVNLHRIYHGLVPVELFYHLDLGRPCHSFLFHTRFLETNLF